MARKNGNATMRLQAPWWEQDEKDKHGNITKEGEWVRVRRYVTHGINRKVQAGMAKFIDMNELDVSQIRDKNDLSSLKLNLNMEEIMKQGNDVQLLEMIVEWNFKDEQGNILSINQEGVDQLLDEDIAYILGEIDKENPAPLTEEQRNAFLQTQTSGTETSTPSETPLPVG